MLPQRRGSTAHGSRVLRGDDAAEIVGTTGDAEARIAGRALEASARSAMLDPSSAFSSASASPGSRQGPIYRPQTAWAGVRTRSMGDCMLFVPHSGRYRALPDDSGRLGRVPSSRFRGAGPGPCSAPGSAHLRRGERCGWGSPRPGGVRPARYPSLSSSSSTSCRMRIASPALKPIWSARSASFCSSSRLMTPSA